MNKQKNLLLIIGTIPPPTGGVTIHVSRLMEHLDKENFPYGFIDYKRNNVLKIFKEIIQYQVLHIHVSNVYFLFSVILFAKIFNKKIIFTSHRDINREYKILNKKIFICCLKMAKIPILLNKDSLNVALKYNRKAIQISSFLPPLREEKLPSSLTSNIEEDKTKYKKLFATNAWRFVVDKQKKEIYGILKLIDLFKKFSNYKLYISNSMGDYEKYIKDNKIEIPKNIQFISYPHSFYKIMKECDAMIRNTNTDGDSISIKEALYFDKKVFATNVVSRPKGVYCYNNIKELENMLNDFENLEIVDKEKNLNGFYIIINLYKNFIEI